MAEAPEKPTIQIKRVKKIAGGHHGGAWKIAYADFVTAMMAFFLLMWLLGSTAKGDLQGISDYFKTPLKVALGGGSGSGDSSSVINGGGTDLTRSSGQVRNGETPAKKTVVDIHAAQAEQARREREALKGLQQKISDLISASPQLAAFKNQLLMDITTEGLRIQIIDDQARPMFDSGRSELKPYTSAILRQLAVTLNGVDNRISLSGHTDSAQYAFGEKGYSNWELSADRANASRRELIAGGLDEKKLIRVEGLGSAVMLNPTNPLDPSNRRISIIVLNRATEQAVLNEGAGALSVSNSDPLEPATIAEATPAAPAATAQTMAPPVAPRDTSPQEAASR